MRQRERVYSNFRQFMTLIFHYNERMKTFSFLDNLLTPSPLIGILWLTLLFILCFLAIHVAKLARIGKRHLKDDNQKPQEKSGENVSSSPQKTPTQPTSSAPSVSPQSPSIISSNANGAPNRVLASLNKLSSNNQKRSPFMVAFYTSTSSPVTSLNFCKFPPSVQSRSKW